MTWHPWNLQILLLLLQDHLLDLLLDHLFRQNHQVPKNRQTFKKPDPNLPSILRNREIQNKETKKKIFYIFYLKLNENKNVKKLINMNFYSENHIKKAGFEIENISLFCAFFL